MKLSKSIDQTRICKKSYDDPLGYFCMGLFFFTCPDGQVTDKFHLSNRHNRTNVIVEAWFMLSFIFCGNMWSFYRLFIVYRYCC